MSKLAEAARELLRDYDAREQEAIEAVGDSFVRDEWQQLEALRAALAEHDVAVGLLTAKQDAMAQRQYQEMQQILADQLSRPRAITLTAPTRKLSEEMLRVWPLEDWHEDDGPAMWWKLPVDEPPWVGSPLDTDWPGYHTHWSRIIIPAELVEESPALREG